MDYAIKVLEKERPKLVAANERTELELDGHLFHHGGKVEMNKHWTMHKRERKIKELTKAIKLLRA